MGKRKAAVITVVVIALLGLISVGALELNSHKNTRSSIKQTHINTPIDSSDNSSNSLQAIGQGSDLGQLNQSSSSSDQGSSSSSDSSSSSAVNPSTFSQYQKYVNNPDALFGDIKVGTGTLVADNQKVSISYQGYLTNGNMFSESSTDSNGDPAPFTFTFGSNSVIPGLEEGMAGMKVGGIRLIIIPPSLGYGNNPPSSSIPANSVLIFEVQLLSAE
jgi:FKBP-type peptidyl-prolyl cis-trans isomerase